eukprot:COSAG02_NODE_1673_length_11384_cov_835.108463_5_plen_81_part_00
MRYDTVCDWVVAKQLLDEIAMIKSAFLVSFYPPSGILRSPPGLAKNIYLLRIIYMVSPGPGASAPPSPRLPGPSRTTLDS